jgi:hypothetical protein
MLNSYIDHSGEKNYYADHSEYVDMNHRLQKMRGGAVALTVESLEGPHRCYLVFGQHLYLLILPFLQFVFSGNSTWRVQ